MSTIEHKTHLKCKGRVSNLKFDNTRHTIKRVVKTNLLETVLSLKAPGRVKPIESA